MFIIGYYAICCNAVESHILEDQLRFIKAHGKNESP